MAVDSYGRTIYETGYDYDDVYRRRLATINRQGQNQTAWERSNKQIEQARKTFDESMSMRYAGLTSDMIGHSNTQSLIDYGSDLQGRVNSNANMFEFGGQVGAAGSGINSFINAISSQESGGNYGAVNRHSGALGKYQIMPSNIPSWSRQALGRSVTPSQFLASPQIQEQVARAQLSSYYQKYGAAGAAIAWYAGPSAAQRYVNTGYISNRREGSYPSIQAYVNQILGRMGRR